MNTKIALYVALRNLSKRYRTFGPRLQFSSNEREAYVLAIDAMVAATITIAEAAEITGKPISTIRMYCTNGKWKVKRSGNSWEVYIHYLEDLYRCDIETIIPDLPSKTKDPTKSEPNDSGEGDGEEEPE